MAGNSRFTLRVIFHYKSSGETWESRSEVLQPGLGREWDLMIIIILLFLKPCSMGSSWTSCLRPAGEVGSCQLVLQEM